MQDLDEFISPLYLNLLNYGWCHGAPEKDDLVVSAIQSRLGQADEKLVSELLAVSNWRHRISASWIAGIKNWHTFRDEIGTLMLERKHGLAGRGYAFALACFADETSVQYLQNYLDLYLRQPELEFEQGETMSALLWIDTQTKSNYSAAYFASGGLWEKFLENKDEHWNLEIFRSDFFQAMEFCQRTYASQ